MSLRLDVFLEVFIDLDLNDVSAGLDDSLLLVLVGVVFFWVIGALVHVWGTFYCVV